jgi:hypothetical protein
MQRQQKRNESSALMKLSMKAAAGDAWTGESVRGTGTAEPARNCSAADVVSATDDLPQRFGLLLALLLLHPLGHSPHCRRADRNPRQQEEAWEQRWGEVR